MRDSIIFYRSFYEAIKDLPDDQFAQCARAILEYALNDQEPDCGGIANVVFSLVKPQIDKNNSRYQNGLKGGRPKTNSKPNKNQTKTKAEPKEEKPEPNYNDNYNDIKESTLKGTKEKQFKPPTVDEVKAYCSQQGYSIDAEKFVDFYESKGWMVGKNKMKDWRAAVRNWNKTDKQSNNGSSPPQKKQQFNDFSQRQYDYSELNRKLFRGGG